MKDKDTRLLNVAGSATVEKIWELIREGADVNAQTENRETALTYAARTNPDPEVIRTLFKAGAKNTWGFDALLYIAKDNPNPEVFNRIKKAGNNNIIAIAIAMGIIAPALREPLHWTSLIFYFLALFLLYYIKTHLNLIF